jgi:NAD(P)-dependent dehydrogenase (short-subunit alcohol dehydrogenase family)
MPQTWVVTGANRGLGLELARQLSAREDTVIATARDPETATDLNALGGNTRVEALDVETPKSIAAFARRLKGAAVDVLFHNAAVGIAGPAVEQVSAEELESHFRVNAIGPLLLTQALLPNLRAGERRLVVAMSSGLGSIEENTSGGWVAYRVSKTALHQLMKTLSAELSKEKLTFVLISPGWVRTRMGGQDAPLSPEESVRAVLKVVDRLTPKDSGRFFNERGREIPW